ncbi:MAG: helix-turn-helix transcriptional regulator [Desulfobulbaceae bacterium]|jgi:hypothetical protein|nr:helix-turn-helix transcriptional regulator [Desulfobulbaceae bacterium]
MKPHTPQERFLTAMLWLLSRERRGFQADMLRNTGINSGYFTKIKKGDVPISEEKADAVAKYLGYHHEQILSLGRWMLDGNDPQGWPGYMAESDGYSEDIGPMACRILNSEGTDALLLTQVISYLLDESGSKKRISEEMDALKERLNKIESRQQ